MASGHTLKATTTWRYKNGLVHEGNQLHIIHAIIILPQFFRYGRMFKNDVPANTRIFPLWEYDFLCICAELSGRDKSFISITHRGTFLFCRLSDWCPIQVLTYLWFKPDLDDQVDFCFLWVSELRLWAWRPKFFPQDSILDVRQARTKCTDSLQLVLHILYLHWKNRCKTLRTYVSFVQPA